MNNMKEMIKHELWTAKEVCEYLRISLPSLYRWIREDKIPSKRVGGTLRFDCEEIMEWMKKNSKGK